MLRIKPGSVVMIRSEAGRCNYFFTEQRQGESGWLCNGRAHKGWNVQSASLQAVNTHRRPPMQFPPLCLSFPLFLKSSIKLVTLVLPSQTSFFA